MNSDDRPHIKVLIIEDDEGHAEIISRTLSKSENICFDIEHAGLLSSGVDFLGKKKFDVILSDLGLPDSMGMETFLKLHNCYPDIPLIVLTALDDETTALSAVQSGAQDYLVKGQIDTSQLIRTIRYAIERQKLIAELEKRLKEIKTLQGLLPMCAWCKNIRDDKGYWKGLEAYIQENTDASFTHGICPKCMKKISPELYEQIRQDNPDLQEQERKQDEQCPSDEPGIADGR
ncbi:MAG: response regulator [Thermodesulfovibrionales bacterium]